MHTIYHLKYLLKYLYTKTFSTLYLILFIGHFMYSVSCVPNPNPAKVLFELLNCNMTATLVQNLFGKKRKKKKQSAASRRNIIMTTPLRQKPNFWWHHENPLSLLVWFPLCFDSVSINECGCIPCTCSLAAQLLSICYTLGSISARLSVILCAQNDPQRYVASVLTLSDHPSFAFHLCRPCTSNNSCLHFPSL